MILRFRFSNFRSFRNETELSMVATRRDEDVATSVVRSQSTGESIKTLPVAAVLGANASGKSNLIKAMSFMRLMVTESFIHGAHSLRLDPFRLDRSMLEEPSLFEVDFIHRGERYQYGFELHRDGIGSEWLHSFPHNRTQSLFDREGNDFQFGRKLHGPNRAIAEITRPDALFLSAAALGNHNFLSSIFQWFYYNLLSASFDDRSKGTEQLAQRLTRQRARVSELVSLADLGVAETRVVSNKLSPMQRRQHREMAEAMVEKSEPDRDDRIQEILRQLEAEQKTVQLLHRTAAEPVPLPYMEESLGTRTWLFLASRALDALDTGGSLIVDELDSSLHPLLMAEVIQLFQSKLSNRGGAQLIFTTHDTTTLGSMTPHEPLSRGQIWFVEKDKTGASRLTPLSDYRPRKGENVERGYLQGRYGGTPRIQGRRLLEVASDAPAPKE